jgi:hypothetical protein
MKGESMNGKENYNGITAFMMRMPTRRARPGTQTLIFFLMMYLLSTVLR